MATPASFSFTEISRLGSGSFGNVSLYRNERGQPASADDPFGYLANLYAIKALAGNRPANVAIFVASAANAATSGQDEDELPDEPSSSFLAKPPVSPSSINEITVLGALSHPNIPLLHAIIETPTTTFLVMEYSPTGTLSPSLPPALLLSTVLPGVASALAHAHDCGYAHLDVKPSNILLSPTFRPRLTDWGTAMPLPPNNKLSAVNGTLQFLSQPEAACYFNGEPYDAVVSDYFALAASLYFCLTKTHVHSLDPSVPLETTLKAIASYTASTLPLPPPFADILSPLLLAGSMHSVRAESLRRTLASYYSQHAPTELSKIENLVARVVGGPKSAVGGLVLGGILWTEEELFEKIAAKYGGGGLVLAPVPSSFAIDAFNTALTNRPPAAFGRDSAGSLEHMYASDTLLVSAPPAYSLFLLSGPSGSGKSSVAAQFSASHKIISQDNYFMAPFVPYEDRSDNSREQFDGNVDQDRLRLDVFNALRTSDVLLEGHVLHRSAELVELADLVVVLEVDPEVCKERRLNRQPRSPSELANLSDYIDKIVTPHYEQEKTFLNSFKDDRKFTFVDSTPAAAEKIRSFLSTRVPISVAEMEGYSEFTTNLSKRGCKVITDSKDISGKCTVLTPYYHQIVTIAPFDSPHLSASYPSFSDLSAAYTNLTPTKTFRGVTVLTDAALVDGLGGVVWDGAYSLVQHFDRHLPLAGRRVVELGCGTGIAGLCLHKAGAASVVLTDQEVDLATINAEMYLSGDSSGRDISVRSLTWGEPTPAGSYPCDYIVASEVTPMLRGHAALCSTVSELLRRSSGATCVLSVDVKSEDTLEADYLDAAYTADIDGGGAFDLLANSALSFLRRCAAEGLSARVASIERVRDVTNMEEAEGCVAAIVYIRA